METPNIESVMRAAWARIVVMKARDEEYLLRKQINDFDSLLVCSPQSAGYAEREKLHLRWCDVASKARFPLPN